MIVKLYEGVTVASGSEWALEETEEGFYLMLVSGDTQINVGLFLNDPASAGDRERSEIAKYIKNSAKFGGKSVNFRG